MFTDLVLLVIGLLLLYIGAEFLVRGSSRLALILRIPGIIVGLTIVAFGTSSPEFLVSFIAAYEGKVDLSVGNIIGSNIANIGLVLGFSVLLRPVRLLQNNVKKELYWIVLVSLLFWIFSFNFVLGRGEGIIFIVLLLILTVSLIRSAIHERQRTITAQNPVPPGAAPDLDTGWKLLDRQKKSVRGSIFLFASTIGIVLLAYGSDVTIRAAENLALQLGVTKTVIGLTIVAFGTSLPEFATGIVSVFKEENDLLLGNVIGSNLFNMLGVAGPVAAFYPITLSRHLVFNDFPLMMAFTLILFYFLNWKGKLNRWVGGILTLVYIMYMIHYIF